METVDPAVKIKTTNHGVDTLELSDIWFACLAHPFEARLEMIRNHYLTQINKMIVEAGRFKEADFSVTFRPEDVQDEDEEVAYVL